MAGEWRTYRIGEIAYVFGGSTPSTADPANFDGDVPWLTPKDLSGAHDRYISRGERNLSRKGLASCSAQLLPAKSVLLSSRAPIGYVAIAKNPVATNQGFRSLVLKPGFDPAFVYYWLIANVDVLERHSSGSTFKELSGSSLKQIEIDVPPLPEQRAIAHILSTLDDKIELNRRMNETLEAMARAIFQSWFVDFDPVHAKMEGRDLGLPKSLADLFPDSLEESELGEIPKEWAVRRIQDVAERVGMGPFGSSIKVETFVSGGIPVISGQHLHSFMMEDNTFNFITLDHAERLKSANVKRGDVVFTHAGNIGQVAYIPENSRYERYVISQRQFFMRCDRVQVAPSFIALYFRSPVGQHKLLANASPSGVPSIARPVTYLRSIQIIVPPKHVMDAFERLIEPILLQFRRNLDVSSTVTALRDALLPKLISGELRVQDAERFVSEVV